MLDQVRVALVHRTPLALSLFCELTGEKSINVLWAVIELEI